MITMVEYQAMPSYIPSILLMIHKHVTKLSPFVFVAARSTPKFSLYPSNGVPASSMTSKYLPYEVNTLRLFVHYWDDYCYYDYDYYY